MCSCACWNRANNTCLENISGTKVSVSKYEKWLCKLVNKYEIENDQVKGKKSYAKFNLLYIQIQCAFVQLLSFKT